MSKDRSESSKRYYLKHKEQIAKQHKEYSIRAKEKLDITRKNWALKNPDKVKQYASSEKRKAYNLVYQKQYQAKNRKILNEKKKARMQLDINFKLSNRLRARMYLVLSGKQKSKPTMELLGADVETVRNHLSSQFIEGMSWDNYGKYGWHIDHIRPCASFDFSDPEQQKACFHYTNLQPLWAKDNLAKKDKWEA